MYEFIFGVEEVGCNDMLFIGVRLVGVDFFEGVIFIIVWWDKKFLCVIVSLIFNVMCYYINILEVFFGFLYFGCSDGIIEVWKFYYIFN